MNRKTIFDTVRHLLGRKFKRAEVEALDAAIDRALHGGAGPRTVSEAGMALIRRFEGCRLSAYPDPGTGGEPWTVGWGATGPGIGPGTVWTQQQADERLAHDVIRYAAEVERAVGHAPTTQEQFDALVSFHYNTGAVGRAALTRKHVAGDKDGAAREFARWNRAGGRVLAGLTRRRAAEAALYRGARA